MTTLCHVVSVTTTAAAGLGAAAFLTLWARNGFRGLPERSR